MSPENAEPGASKPKSVSMHDQVEIREDCCVCEPEPRWQKLAEELEAEQKARETKQAATADSGPKRDVPGEADHPSGRSGGSASETKS